MSRRTRNILIALILLALLLLGFWLLFGRRTEQGTAVPEDINTDVSKPLGLPSGSYTGGTGGTNTVTVPPIETPPPEPIKIDPRDNLRRLAAAFAERYGSFSNISDFENLLDLKAYMTAAMAAETDAYVADARSKASTSAEFYGSTTRAISTEVTVFDETAGSAEVMVQTQRHVVSGGDSVFYQQILIKYRKEGEVWKVNSAAWQPRE